MNTALLVGRGATIEGVTEVAQKNITDAISKITYDKTRKIPGWVWNEFWGGVGGGVYVVPS